MLVSAPVAAPELVAVSGALDEPAVVAAAAFAPPALLLTSVYAGGNSTVSGSCPLGSASPPSSCWIKFTALNAEGGMPALRPVDEAGPAPPISLIVVTDNLDGARPCVRGAPDAVVIDVRGGWPECVECNEWRELVSGSEKASGKMNGSGS